MLCPPKTITVHEKLAIGPTVVLEILTIARRHQNALSEGVYLVAYSIKAHVDTTRASYMMNNTSVLHKFDSRIQRLF